jgi:hypothetical protein
MICITLPAIVASLLSWCRRPNPNALEAARLFVATVARFGAFLPASKYATTMVIASCSLSATGLRAGEIMYGTDAGADLLYTVDIETGEFTPLGPAGMGVGASTPTALAVHPLNGRIFVANNSPEEVTGLLEVNRHTGIATFIGGSVRKLAFDGDGILYTQMGGNGFAGPAPLGVVDITTGEATSLGGSDIPRLFGLSFNPADGHFYGITIQDSDTIPTLLKIATTGALVSELAMSHSIFVPGDLAFDSQGNLIGNSIADQLFDIDPMTGTMSNFRSGPGAQGMDRITVPEPGAFILLGLGLALTCTRVRGRRKGTSRLL